jgi:uncharacterized membrane protein
MANHQLFIVYPFLSWSGLMMLGYCCGKIFTHFDVEQRNKILLRIGIGLLVFFVILRATNLYGNPFPWTHQKNALYSFFSFMNVHKYPPSLLYMCATIGPCFNFPGTRKKYTKLVCQDNDHLWKGSLILLYFTFLFIACSQYGFLFIERPQFCRRYERRSRFSF